MKKIAFLTIICCSYFAASAQFEPRDTAYNEAGLLAKMTEAATEKGYTKPLKLATDTSRTFTARPGIKYRLVLIFRDKIATPGRRLVAHQLDKDGKMKTMYMAKVVNGFKEFNGKAMITDVPAMASGETDLVFRIDALPVEGKLYIFTSSPSLLLEEKGAHR